MKSNSFISNLVFLCIGFVIGSMLILRMDITLDKKRVDEATNVCISNDVREYIVDYSGRIQRVKCGNGEFKELL